MVDPLLYLDSELLGHVWGLSERDRLSELTSSMTPQELWHLAQLVSET